MKQRRMPGHVGGDGFVCQQLAGFVLAGRVADARGAAAQQHQRLVAVFLQQAQDHDLHEAADMQAVGSAIKADIGGDRSGVHGRGQRAGVGALEDEAARGGFLKETVGRHGG